MTYSFSYLEPVCCSISSSTCGFLTCIQVSQEAGQVVWYSHLFQNFPRFVVIHTVKGFAIVNKAEVDVFLELSCFFNDSTDVGNLIFGSSAFSKSSLNSWKSTAHILLKPQFNSVQFISVAQSCPNLCDPMNYSMLGLPVHHQLLEFTQTHAHQVGDAIHLILCHPLLFLPSIFPSNRVFSNESALHIRWPKYWSFSFSISSSNEHPGLISFRIDCLDLLAVQGTLKSLLQHNSSKA